MVITSDIDVCNLMRFKEHSFTVYTVCHTTCVYIPVDCKTILEMHIGVSHMLSVTKGHRDKLG